ncbi:nucleosome assembly protein 1-like 1-A [Sitodiplosis mosellana]|uniref:nucleosome assembly protein 1-like 1-A n=1 Tax=Sitodiplosis mosellana TaxID=263140 RepID=UPI0024446AFE|nr:nucleosome assembly protein 1-like 1-A [Sitodiplosis mosellana]
MENFEQVANASDSKSFQALQDRLQALKMLQREYVRVEMDFHRHFYALDMEYQQKRQEIYGRRKDVISGSGDCYEQVPPDVVNGVMKAMQKLHLNKYFTDETKDIKGIPNFWLQAIKNCTHNDDLVHECDEEALSYLLDIKVSLVNEPDMSFTLEFEFAPNPFFENSVLAKQYFLSCDTNDEFYGFSIIRAIGCSIEWKDGANITEKELESFFMFFNPPELSESPDTNSLEFDSNIFFELQQDFEIGLFIKEKLIPNAVLYYLNEVDEVIDFGASSDNDETIVSNCNF